MTIRTLNRRQIVGMAGAGLTLLGFRAARAAAGALADWAAPDFVVLNAKIYTMDPQLPQIEAFAVKDGRFVALGSTRAMKDLAGKSQTIDAQQMTVVPGFIDSHNHAPGNELLYEVLVGNPYEVEFVTIASIIDKLRVKAQKTPADTWVEGYFFDDTKVKDGRQLDIHDLDRVSTTQPVAVHHRGGHTSFYNSRALAMAGVTTATPDLPSGTYDRFPDGSLNGRVTDRARDPLWRVGRRVTYDAANALAQEDPVAGVARLGRYLAIAHVSDAWRTRWAHTSVGRGEVDFAAFAGALTAAGFAGPTVYELVDGEDPAPRLPADLAALEKAGWSVDAPAHLEMPE